MQIISNILYPFSLYYRFLKQTNVSVLRVSTQQSCGNCWLMSEVHEAGLRSNKLEVPGSVALPVYMTKFRHVFTKK
jgi:hypothetical protein